MFSLTTLAMSSGLINSLGPISPAQIALLAGFMIVLIILGIALYIYTALAWQTIAQKLGYSKPWLAWIPVANFFLLPILAKKNAWWGTIIVIPIIFEIIITFFTPAAIRGDYTAYTNMYLSTLGIMILFMLFIGIMAITWLWKIYELRGYPGYLSLTPILIIIPIIGILAIIAHFIILGMVAWKDRMPVTTVL